MGVSVMIVILLAIIALALLPTILFLRAQSELLKQVSPQNRAMQPGSVWLVFIPLFGTIWMFVTIVKVRDSVADEFRSRGWPPAGDYGFGVGLAWAILSLFSGILGLVFWIIYWVKIVELKNTLLAAPVARASVATPASYAPQRPLAYQPQPQLQPQSQPWLPPQPLPQPWPAAAPSQAGWIGATAAPVHQPVQPVIAAESVSSSSPPRSVETTAGLAAASAVLDSDAWTTDRISAAFVRGAAATTGERAPTRVEAEPGGGGAHRPVSAEKLGVSDTTAPFRLVRFGSGPGGEEAWILPKGHQVHVGRDDDCFLMLNDGKVSRKHALLAQKDGSLYVTDLGSSNGTRVNEDRLGAEERKVSPGDKIRFGDTTFEVKG